MIIEEKLKLALEIAKRLNHVRRTEWNKWVNYFIANDLEKALTLAQLLSNSQMLRYGPKTNYKTIYNVLNNKKEQLKKIIQENHSDLFEIFGYISWKIK